MSGPPASMAPPRPASASDAVVADVMRGLYEGRYVAGQRLLEPDLMRQYDVGRGVVREAIKRIVAEGVAVTHPHRGAQIRWLTRREALDALLIIELLIGLAARQSAEAVAAGAAPAPLRAAADALMPYEGRPDGFELLRTRNAFYRAMIRLSGNAELARVLPLMHVNLIRAQARMAALSTRFDDYRAIAGAILAGDAVAAEIAGRDHAHHVSRIVAKLPDDVFAREAAR